jgi:hypothetical protein
LKLLERLTDSIVHVPQWLEDRKYLIAGVTFCIWFPQRAKPGSNTSIFLKTPKKKNWLKGPGLRSSWRPSGRLYSREKAQKWEGGLI